MTTNRFNGETENVCHLLTGKRKGDCSLVARLRFFASRWDEALGRLNEVCSQFLFGIHPSQQDHPSPRSIQLRERALKQLVLKTGMLAGLGEDVARGGHEGRFLGVDERFGMLIREGATTRLRPLTDLLEGPR